MLYKFSIMLSSNKTLDFYFEEFGDAKALVDMCFKEGYMLQVTPAEIYGKEQEC